MKSSGSRYYAVSVGRGSAKKSRVDGADACVDPVVEAGVHEANVGIGNNCPHHRLASMEGVEHGVSHGGGDAVGQSGGHMVGPEGHVVDDACAICHWENGVVNVGMTHGRRDHAGHNGHGVESSPGVDSIHLNLHGLCLPLGHPMDVLDGGLRMDPLHHVLHLPILGDVGGVMDSCCNGHHVVGLGWQGMEWMTHDVAHGMAGPEGHGVDHSKAGVSNVVAASQQVVVDHPVVDHAVVVEEGAVVGHLAGHHVPLRKNNLCKATRCQKGNSGQQKHDEAGLE